MVQPEGEIDAGNAGDLERAIEEAARADHHVIVDMEHVTFMGSSGLNCLLRSRRALEQRGGTLTVRNPPRLVRRMLEITGMTDFLESD